MRLFVLPLLFSFDGFILAERLSQYYRSNYSLIQSNSIRSILCLCGRKLPGAECAAAEGSGGSGKRQAARSQKASLRPPREAEERGRNRPQQAKKQDCGLPGRRGSGRKAGRNKLKSKNAACPGGGGAEEKQAATSQKAGMRPAREAEERMKSRPQQAKKQDCGLPDRRSSGREAGRNKSKSKNVACPGGRGADERQAATREKASMRPPRHAEERGKSRPQQAKKQECGLPVRRGSGREAGRNKPKSRIAASQTGGAAREKQAATS